MSRYSKAIKTKEWETRQKEWDTKKLSDKIKESDRFKSSFDSTSAQSSITDTAAMNLSLDCLNITLM